jgi:hypothetical protein
MIVAAPSFQLTCQNSGICNPDISDDVIGVQIKQNCPPNTFSWIDVRSMPHQFTTVPTPQAIPSRFVQFQSTTYQSCKHILSILIRRTELETLILNQVARGILGSNNPDDQTAARSAFWQNYTITLFVSMDGSYNYDVFPEQGKTTQVAALVATTYSGWYARYGTWLGTVGWWIGKKLRII